jgi:hypothetical protein
MLAKAFILCALNRPAAILHLLEDSSMVRKKASVVEPCILELILNVIYAEKLQEFYRTTLMRERYWIKSQS